MERFEISSNLFPCVSVNTYETMLSPVQLEDEAMACNECERRAFDYAYCDCDELDKGIVTYAMQWIEREVLPVTKKYGLERFEDISIHHPREYNFMTDWLNFTAVMQDGWREKMHEWLAKFTDGKFREYIRENFESRSGFVSLMPTTYAEIERMQDEKRCLGAYLTLCLLNEQRDADNLRDFLMESQGMVEEGIICNGYDTKIHNAFEEQFADADTESLLNLYDSEEIDLIYWQIVERTGSPWLHDASTKKCDGEHESVDATNQAQRFIVWAAQNGYDAAELRRMAA